MKNPFIRCVATCADGSRCAKAARRGSNPALCAFHDGSTQSAVVAPDDQIDEVKILRKLARDANPQVRLRAVDLLLSLKAKEPPVAKRQSSLDFKRLTPDERTRLETHLLALRALKEEVWARDPEQRPDGWFLPSESAPVITPSDPMPVSTVLIEPQPEPTPEQPTTLPKAQWAEVGLFEMNGVITHAHGDDHAQAILDGRIPFEEAREAQQRADHETQSLK